MTRHYSRCYLDGMANTEKSLEDVILLQKINTLLLCESALDTPENEKAIDPGFIRAALVDGQFWALRHKLMLIDDVSREVASETQKILHMWTLIEYSYSELSEDDRESLPNAIRLFGRFPGFDGNAEAGHLSVARFLIDRLGEYQAFKGRDLSMHAPSFLDGYRRMLPVFHEIVMRGIANPMSKDSLVSVLQSMRHPRMQEEAPQ